MLFAKASAAEREALRLACEQDLLTFTALMFRARMAQPFLVNWHHAKIVDALMAVYRGEIHNLLITMPPGGTKTELAVIHFMAWCFARSPHCRFLHLSGAAELAALNSATVKEIIELDEFQSLWPRRIRPDTRAKSRWNIDVGGRTAGGVYATSTGGQVTGFRAGYIRPGFSGAIIIDDPLKADDVWSDAKREAANRKITGTIRSRRASTEHTPVILIMQRLHEDDPAGHALAGDYALDFTHLEIQAVLDEDTDKERSYWPEKESLASLQELREKDPFTFAAQYQQRPTSLGGVMFKRDMIQRFRGRPEGLVRAGIFCDTAMKEGEKNDYSVLLYAATDDRDVYILDLDRGKWTAPVLLERAKSFWERHKPHRISNPLRFTGCHIEDKASGTGLIQTLRAQTSIPVIAVQRNRDKVSRANDVLPYVAGGRLYIPDDQPWADALIAELCAFSPAMTHAHDDQVDTVVDAIDTLLMPTGGMLAGADWS